MLQSLTIGSHQFATPVFLAPMAGITDAPFRAQVRRFGAGLVCSEMVASAAFTVDNKDAVLKARVEPTDGVAAVQIAGRDPELIVESARAAEAGGAALIDLNFGCPAKKVTSGAAGAALMREPCRALRIVEATARAVAAPVTVKMRLGWDDAQRNALELVRGAADAGAQAATIHGRTRAQAYSGTADWAAIGEVAARSPIPIIANGDITSPDAAVAALRISGAAGVMVGRGAQGAPWVLAAIMAALEGRRFEPPSAAEQLRLAAEYHHEACRRHGAHTGVRAARKHLGWRVRTASRGCAWGEALRVELMRMEAPDDVQRALIHAAGALEAGLIEPQPSAAA